MSKTKKYLKKKRKTNKKRVNGGGGIFSKTIPGYVSIIPPEPIELFNAIIYRENEEVIVDLINRGVNVHSLHNSFTSLHYACMYRLDRIIKMLIDKNVNVHIKNVYGKTALHYACEYGVLEGIEALYKKGADLNVSDIYGNTPLHVACNVYNMNIVKFLVERGVDVNVINNEGDTPLHQLCKSMYNRTDNIANICFNIAKYLINKGAKIDVINNQQKTALDYVKTAGWKKILEDISAKYQYNLHKTFDYINYLMKNGEETTGPLLHIGEYHGVPRGGKSMNKKRRKTNKIGGNEELYNQYIDNYKYLVSVMEKQKEKDRLQTIQIDNCLEENENLKKYDTQREEYIKNLESYTERLEKVSKSVTEHRDELMKKLESDKK